MLSISDIKTPYICSWECNGVWENAISLKGFSIHLSNCEKWWKYMLVIVFEGFMRLCEEFCFSRAHDDWRWKSYVLVIIIRNNDVIIIFKRIFLPSFPFQCHTTPKRHLTKEMWAWWMREKFITMRCCGGCDVMWKIFYFCCYCCEKLRRVGVERLNENLFEWNPLKGFDLHFAIFTLILD